MKSLLATLFRIFFKIPFLRHSFFAFHKKLFAPYHLFKGTIKQVKFKENINLELHIDDWIQENIYFTGTYEDAELKYIQSSLKKGDIFIDIGANIGVHSLFSSNIVGNNGRVFSFEPYSKNYQSLKKNIAINNISNIIVENKAVSDTDGFINIYYNNKEANLGMVSSFIKEYSDFEKVNVITLDCYFKVNSLQKIDFIKLDIEGSEYNALIGMEKTLEKYSPKLLIEILDKSNSTQQNNEENIMNFLEKINYKRYFIDNNGQLSSVNKNKNRRNFIFIKD